MLCAGIYGKGPCDVSGCQVSLSPGDGIFLTNRALQGDAGGPLVHQNSSSAPWYQYGITSWGNDCDLTGDPGERRTESYRH